MNSMLGLTLLAGAILILFSISMLVFTPWLHHSMCKRNGEHFYHPLPLPCGYTFKGDPCAKQ